MGNSSKSNISHPHSQALSHLTYELWLVSGWERSYRVQLDRRKTRGERAARRRVKGRSHTVVKRISMHPYKPQATSQLSRFSHTHRLSTDSRHGARSCQLDPGPEKHTHHTIVSKEREALGACWRAQRSQHCVNVRPAE